ncbi:MAG TPA: sigma-E factor negative regulatory protein [Gammaproteobacteria bacterium]|nr:sigma-E factor negative regulatory protein [Gammaproteobacteria bacterium]
MDKLVKQKLREQVSALVDSELPAGEHELLLRRFAVERSLRLHWERCHLIGEAMRKGLPAADTRGFADRVMASLADEPVPAEKPTRFGGTLIRGIAGAAVAASVAMVAILGLRHDPHQQPGYAPSEIVPGAALSAQTQPISGDFVNTANWQGQLPPVQAALRANLVEQDDMNSSLTSQGLQPYRYIARPAPRQPEDIKNAPKDDRPPRQP